MVEVQTQILWKLFFLKILQPQLKKGVFPFFPKIVIKNSYFGYSFSQTEGGVIYITLLTYMFIEWCTFSPLYFNKFWMNYLFCNLECEIDFLKDCIVGTNIKRTSPTRTGYAALIYTHSSSSQLLLFDSLSIHSNGAHIGSHEGIFYIWFGELKYSSIKMSNNRVFSK